jgi:hypothetical protein
MNAYNLKDVIETSLPQGSSTIYQVPVDSLGNIPDYLNKDRIIEDGQMLVFDTRQEYLDYLNSHL